MCQLNWKKKKKKVKWLIFWKNKLKRNEFFIDKFPLRSYISTENINIYVPALAAESLLLPALLSLSSGECSELNKEFT